MKLLVVSSAPLIASQNQWKAYVPYVNEMEIWEKYVDQIQFCCPVWETDRGLLVKTVPFVTAKTIHLIAFDIKSYGQVFKALYAVAINLVRIAKAMQQADHIHLRCPGNMGLLGAMVQIAFPHKPKTAKYAGNWDSKSQQPWSYKLQKWILSNTFLTRNMQVLVYGAWEGSTKNIKPFFTATYRESEKEAVVLRRIDNREIGGDMERGDMERGDMERGDMEKGDMEKEDLERGDLERGDLERGDLERGDLERGDLEKGDLEKGRLGDEESGGIGDLEKRVIRFLFVGTLSKGKRPLYAVQLVEQLHLAGYSVHLDLYGAGAERNALEIYIQEKGLQDIITLHGNQTTATVQTAYENSHFLVLPSQSEGWPKVVAEAMFWGCVPVASAVSCVPNMLDHGERGLILTMDIAKDIQQIKHTLNDQAVYQSMASKAITWSRQYTLDYFEEEIRVLLKEL